MDCKTGFSLKHSYGSIDFTLEAHGIDKAGELGDYIVSGGTRLGETEAVRKLSIAPAGDSTKQTCASSFTFGDVSMSITIDFDLNVEVTNRNLNDIVTEFMLLAWTAYGKITGNQRSLGKKASMTVITADVDKILELVSAQSSNGYSAAAAGSPGNGRNGRQQHQQPRQRPRAKAGSSRQR